MGQRWIQLNSPGAAGAPGPPGPGGGTAAPNVTTATLTVSYQPYGNSQQFLFGGVITLPTGSPDYAHLKKIDVVAIDPNGQSITVISFTSWSGSTITYSGIVGDQPTADQVWSAEFIAYNEDGNPTTSPFTLTGINVFAPAITSLVGAEVAGARYQDVLQGLHTVVSATVSLGHSQYPQTVTFWIDYDDGRGPTWNGSDNITGPGHVTRFGDPISIQGQQQPGTIWVPPPGQSAWKMYAFPGYTGNAPVPGGAILSSFTVTAVAQCLPNDVSQAQFNPQPVSGDPIVYTLHGVGTYLWDYYQLQFFQPSLSSDPNYWFTFLSIQKGRNVNGTGTVSGGTTFTKTSGISFDASWVGEDIHIAGVLTTIATFVSTTTVTLTDAQPNGSGKSYNVFVQAPDPEGVDESTPYMLYPW